MPAALFRGNLRVDGCKLHPLPSGLGYGYGLLDGVLFLLDWLSVGISLLQIRGIDNREALGWWVELLEEVFRDGVSGLIPVEDDAHRNTAVVFIQNGLDELLRVAVFDALTDFSVGTKELDPANGTIG